MKVKVGDYIQIKTKEEMLKYKSLYGGYKDTTRCGWDPSMESTFGTKVKVTSITDFGNYQIKDFGSFISPDWCKNPRNISFKQLYREII